MALAAIAASTALPPALRMSSAALVASGWLVAAMPCRAITSLRLAKDLPVTRSPATAGRVLRASNSGSSERMANLGGGQGGKHRACGGGRKVGRRAA